MTMTRPSQDADRLHTVQRVARYILSRDSLGQARYTSMDVFPPELPVPKSGTPEYAWRSQLVWAWTKAGYMHEGLAGTGLQKRRIYTLLQAGREALERIATEPNLASFYIPNKRSATGAEDRPPEFYRPPELVRLSARQLRIVPPKVARQAPEPEPEESEESEEQAEEDEPAPLQRQEAQDSDASSELKDLPIFFERITSVLENMNGRIAKVGERLSKVESETRDQSALLLEATQALSSRAGKDALVTKGEVAEVLAELTQSFVKDNVAGVALTAALKKHEEFHVQLSGEISNLALAAKKAPVVTDAAAMAKDAAALSKTISDVLTKEVGKLIVPMVREAMAQEIAPGLTPVIEAIIRTEDKLRIHTSGLAVSAGEKIEGVKNSIGMTTDSISKDVQQRLGSRLGSISEGVGKSMDTLTASVESRIAALATSIEARMTAVGPDLEALRKLSDKIQSEVTSTCEELKDDLSSISADAQDLGETLEVVAGKFELGQTGFKRQAQTVVDGFTQVSNAANVVMEGARAVATEMVILARLRAAKAGVTYEEALEASNAAIVRVAEAQDKIGGAVSALGGGLIRPTGNADGRDYSNMKPIIHMPDEEDES
jgi:hypothetical protein